MGAAKSNEQFFLNDGTRVDATNLGEINKRMRETIKKYNNPIDLERKIIYP